MRQELWLQTDSLAVPVFLSGSFLSSTFSTRWDHGHIMSLLIATLDLWGPVVPHRASCVNCGGNVLSVTLLTLSLSLQLFQHRLCSYKELNSQWWCLHSGKSLASSDAILKNNSQLNISWINGANTAGSRIRKLTFFHHLPEHPTSPTLESTDD